jgi:hypothetical protein
MYTTIALGAISSLVARASWLALLLPEADSPCGQTPKSAMASRAVFQVVLQIRVKIVSRKRLDFVDRHGILA